MLCHAELCYAMLCSRRFIKRDHIVRPYIAELLRLYPHFRIGVFSSATARTVNVALDTLYAALQRSTARTGIGEQHRHTHTCCLTHQQNLLCCLDGLSGGTTQHTDRHQRNLAKQTRVFGERSSRSVKRSWSHQALVPALTSAEAKCRYLACSLCVRRMQCAGLLNAQLSCVHCSF
jgi:hypothetical protein